MVAIYVVLGIYLGGVVSHLMTYWIYSGRFVHYRDWVDKTLVLETLLWPIALPVGAIKAKQELKNRLKSIPPHKGYR